CRQHAATLLARGKSPDQVVADLAAAGWHTGSARRLVEEARFPERNAARAIRVPAADLRGLPSLLRVGGRQVRLQARSRHPDACLFGNFASGAECAAIVAAAKPGLVRSQVVVADGELAGTGTESYYRTSEQAV